MKNVANCYCWACHCVMSMFIYLEKIVLIGWTLLQTMVFSCWISDFFVMLFCVCYAFMYIPNNRWCWSFWDRWWMLCFIYTSKIFSTGEQKSHSLWWVIRCSSFTVLRLLAQYSCSIMKWFYFLICEDVEMCSYISLEPDFTCWWKIFVLQKSQAIKRTCDWRSILQALWLQYRNTYDRWMEMENKSRRK